jgi:hypothetical protein
VTHSFLHDALPIGAQPAADHDHAEASPTAAAGAAQPTAAASAAQPTASAGGAPATLPRTAEGEPSGVGVILALAAAAVIGGVAFRRMMARARR